MLEIKNLYSGYDEKDILKDINFKVKNGENLCVLFPHPFGPTIHKFSPFLTLKFISFKISFSSYPL